MMRDRTKDLLTDRGLKVTPQRVAVLEFLLGNPNHPSVDDVYQGVRRQLPSISRATIYNTVATLVAEGLLHELLVEQAKTHVDASVHPHHHFRCVRCQKIHDIDYDVLIPERASNLVADYAVKDVRLLLEGLCRDCR